MHGRERISPLGTTREHLKINSSSYSLSDSLFPCVDCIIPLSLSFSDRNLLVILQRFALNPFLKLQNLEDLRRKKKKKETAFVRTKTERVKILPGVRDEIRS